MESCPRCNEKILVRKNGDRYCRNGCDICTAMPMGDKYYDVTGSVTDEDSNITSFGGINNLRRMPTCKE